MEAKKFYFTPQSDAAAVEDVFHERGRPILEREARILLPALKVLTVRNGGLESGEILAVYEKYLALKIAMPHIDPENMELWLWMRSAIGVAESRR
jgi:hypothetical protein